MTRDLQELDERNRETWRRAAGAWEKWQAQLREQTAPVSRWMLDAIRPQPGQRVLELAAGPGETGFLAAERIAPDGTLISSDQSEEMVTVARQRAQELGLTNVEFAVLDAQRMPLEADSVDAVLCRWGYMLMADADSALAQTRRVLRPRGPVAMAAWDTPDRNLWMSVPALQLVARGVLEIPEPGLPGPFSMADVEQLRERLIDAGFSEIHVDKVEYPHIHPSFEQYWEMTIDLAAPLQEPFRALDPAAQAEVRDTVRGVLLQFTSENGVVTVPASAVVASAVAT